jgi:inner membrane protein
MDPLTHTATGLFLSRAGLERFSPRASAILMLAANAPDIDIIAAGWGALAYLNYHRHLTHALPPLPLVALLPVLAVRLFTRGPFPWKRAYFISLAGVASHVALDWTNLYGVRLWLPFSSAWYRLDITSVVDLWIWAAALLALAAPVLVRLVHSEIGAREDRRAAARRFARFALAFLLLYNGARAVLHQRAVSVLEARIYGGAAPLRVAAFPSAANPLGWRGVVETRERYSLHEISLAEEFDPDRGQILYKPEPSPALEAAARTRTFQEFLRFAQYPYWRVLPETGNHTQVQTIDLRFGTPQRPSFIATAVVNERRQVVRAWFQFGAPAPR